MTKEDNEDFQSSTKCWFCDNDYVGHEVLHIEIIISILS